MRFLQSGTCSRLAADEPMEAGMEKKPSEAGEQWVEALRAQGLPDTLIEEAKANAAKLAAAADGLLYDLSDPIDPNGLTLTEPRPSGLESKP